MSDELMACPFCGTAWHIHEYCISHPKPAQGDCVLRHYSFGVPSQYETIGETIVALNQRAAPTRPTAASAVEDYLARAHEQIRSGQSRENTTLYARPTAASAVEDYLASAVEDYLARAREQIRSGQEVQ